jgi:hypothetical protein
LDCARSRNWAKTTPPVKASSSAVASIEQETGPRAKTSALMAVRPATRPCSVAVRRA